MWAEIGNFSIITAAILQCLVCLSPILWRLGGKNYSYLLVAWLTIGQFVLFSLGFSALIYCFASSDFSVLLVAQHSHALKPLLYKITGAWGNHEGSMLLWVWELSLITAAFCLFSNYDKQIKTYILIVQAALLVSLTLFVLCTSNPFIRVFPPPKSGSGLNPLLQDVGLATHPPALYMGYVGFSIAYSAAIVALLRGKYELSYAKHLRFWVLGAWSFLTLGITLGSRWAYRELGWGGFWFWDPVENASLMPWLAGTALLHALLSNQKRNILPAWVILLAILSFSLSLLGTFFVRSGILTSVHSFASDPKRGVFILVLLALVTGIAMVLFAARSSKLRSNLLMYLWSREWLILAGNVLLVSILSTVILGTIYPIFYQLFSGKQITVGMPYFVSTFGTLSLPIILVAGIGPHLKWHKDMPKRLLGSFLGHMLIALIITTIYSYVANSLTILNLVMLAFAVFLMSSILTLLVKELQLFKVSLDRSWMRATALPINFYAMVMAHLAVAIMAISICVVTSQDKQQEIVMQVGDKTDIAGYHIELQNIKYSHGPNYFTIFAKLYVTHNGDEVTFLHPEIRFYPVERTTTTESSIHSSTKGDLYAAIGEFNDKDQSIMVRLYYKPLIGFLWLASGIMVVAGFMASYGAFTSKTKRKLS